MFIIDKQTDAKKLSELLKALPDKVFALSNANLIETKEDIYAPNADGYRAATNWCIYEKQIKPAGTEPAEELEGEEN